MTRSKKLLLAVFTAWPFVYIPIFVIFFFCMIINMNPHSGPPIALFVIHGITMLLMLALTIFYVVHAIQNTRLKEKGSTELLLWIIIILFGGPIGDAIYWYMHIWRE